MTKAVPAQKEGDLGWSTAPELADNWRKNRLNRSTTKPKAIKAKAVRIQAKRVRSAAKYTNRRADVSVSESLVKTPSLHS